MKKLKLTEILTISPALSFLIPWKQVWRGNLMKSLQRKWLSPCKFWFLVSIQLWSWRENPVSRHFLIANQVKAQCILYLAQVGDLFLLVHWGEQNAMQAGVGCLVYSALGCFEVLKCTNGLIFGNGRIGKKEPIVICICIADSLCYTAETNTPL